MHGATLKIYQTVLSSVEERLSSYGPIVIFCEDVSFTSVEKPRQPRIVITGNNEFCHLLYL